MKALRNYWPTAVLSLLGYVGFALTCYGFGVQIDRRLTVAAIIPLWAGILAGLMVR